MFRLRGLTLFGSLLALAVTGVLVAGMSRHLEQRLVEAREERATEQLVVLARAAHGFAIDSLADLLGGNTEREIAIDELRNGGFIGPGFAANNVQGRGYRILVRQVDAGVVDLVVTQTVPVGDIAWPWRSITRQPIDTMRLGTVHPDEPARLQGPGIDIDISQFQNAFAGVPETRALAAYTRLDRSTVFGDQLYRTAVNGFPEINRMQTDLDMGGNDIANAGAIEADTIAVADILDVGGDLTVVGELVVGRSLIVDGDVSVDGELTAGSAAIAGVTQTESVQATDIVRATNLQATGTIEAANLGISQDLTIAGTAVMQRLTAASVSASTVTVDTVAANAVDADQLIASSEATAAEAGFSQLIVGSCTGC